MKTLLVIGLLAGMAFVGMAPSAAAQARTLDPCAANVATSCANGAICAANVGVPVLGPNYSCGGSICVANVLDGCHNSICVGNIATWCGSPVCVANVLTTCGSGSGCVQLPGLDEVNVNLPIGVGVACVTTICIGNVLTSCGSGICIANVASDCNGPVCVANVLTTCGTLYDLLYSLAAFGNGGSIVVTPAQPASLDSLVQGLSAFGPTSA